MQPAPAPLFRDPIFDGAADPTIIWNQAEQAWWLFYTNRRANVEAPGFSWVHGTDIGIASSADGGRTWIYRGIAEGLTFARGRNTYWAPEIIAHAGRYHMYVSYVPGVPHHWFGTRHILHYTSANLWDWRFESQLALSSDRVIDACVFQMPSGQWRLWYKDEAQQSHTYAADSDDLHRWHVVGPVITDCAHEGPNVFAWQGAYWMVTDHWTGLGVYRSADCEHWTRQADLLVQPGQRVDDAAYGHHADVLVQGDDAYLFYFTHPHEKSIDARTAEGLIPYAYRRTSLQVARLHVVDGVLTCDRDEAYEFVLRSPDKDIWVAGAAEQCP